MHTLPHTSTVLCAKRKFPFQKQQQLHGQGHGSSCVSYRQQTTTPKDKGSFWNGFFFSLLCCRLCTSRLRRRFTERMLTCLIALHRSCEDRLIASKENSAKYEMTRAHFSARVMISNYTKSRDFFREILSTSPK